MSMLTELLGSTLLVNGGERKETAAALAGKGAVALYFSAHWCPPCRGFTPKLAEWYKSDLSNKGLEVVFVSSDQDENAFKEYFGEMPWLALPYEDRDAKERLSKKFKVQGIPSMVILDSDGKTITTDGRDAVSSDPTGEEFPWKPIPPKELLAKAKLINAEGEVSLSKAIDGKKAVLLYFSAHWCPPCRGFTPMLADWYKSNLSSKGLEVIFVSSDEDENQFKEYFAEMPWLALEYSDRKLKGQLSKAFGVSGIPSLVVLDTDLNLITKEGRSAITEDPEGNELPWHPKPVKNLKNGPGDINETPTVIAFCETSTVEEQKALEAVLTPIAEKYIQKAKESEEDLEFSFTMATGGSGIVAQVRGMLGFPSLPPAPHEHPLQKKESGGGWGCDGCGCSGEGKDRYQCSQGCNFDFCGECNAKTSQKPVATPPRLALIDIPSDGAYYLAPEGAGLGTSEVELFLADYKAGKLERKQMG